MLTNNIQDILQGFESVTSVESFNKRMLSLKSDLGFDHLTYAIVNSPNAKIDNPLPCCSYRSDWLDYYFTHDCINSDPIIRSAQNAHMPYMWDDLRTSKQERSFMNRARDFEIKGKGVTIPVRRSNNELALISACANVSDKKWVEIANTSLPTLRYIADYGHDSFMRKFSRDVSEAPEVKLTSRERECLLWTARGKSNWEIANILHISERTVTFHIGNACQKLEVNGRFQGVVKAISLCLIFP